MKNVVLFTGLLRVEDSFLKELDFFNDMKKLGYVDEVVFSTWENSVTQEQKDKIGDRIDHYVEQPALERDWHIQHIPQWDYWLSLGWKNLVGINLNCADNTLRQQQTTKAALEYIGDDALVVRSRADMVHCKEFFKNYLKDGLKPAKGDMFEYKFWAPSFEMFHPWEIKEWVFIGYSKDMKKLIHCNEIIEDNHRVLDYCNGGAARWIYPFLKDSKNLRDILSKPFTDGKLGLPKGKESVSIHHPETNIAPDKQKLSWLVQYYCLGPAKEWHSQWSREFIVASINNSLFIKVLGEYYLNIYKYFDIGIGRDIKVSSKESFACYHKKGDLFNLPVSDASLAMSSTFIGNLLTNKRIPQVCSNHFIENIVLGNIEEAHAKWITGVIRELM